MAYVPGYQHDLFISYAHGDDRVWIAQLATRLEFAIRQRLGVAPVVWIDKNELRASRDFSKEIPDSVRASAVFLLLTSPTYIRSSYCVDEECRTFSETLEGRRARFAAGFERELFAFRCPLLPTDGNEHWSLFPGLTDIPFCDDSDTFAIGGTAFETSFRRLVVEVVGLLKRMRNQSTSVFLYPPEPGPDVTDAHKALTAELSVRSFRILPDRKVNLSDQLREASLSVFLLGASYDNSASDLVALASQAAKPWVVWCSPAAEQSATVDQTGFCSYVEQLDAPRKTYLRGGVVTAKLKEEVLALAGPDPLALQESHGKPRVYLVYNARDRSEVRNAGLISFHFRNDVLFEHPDDPAQHTVRLTRSDGVLLVWGSADEDWCSREFAEMVQTSRTAGAQGLCLFDPFDAKATAVRAIRDGFQTLFVAEQFGKFEPSRLVPFFTPLVRRQAERRP